MQETVPIITQSGSTGIHVRYGHRTDIEPLPRSLLSAIKNKKMNQKKTLKNRNKNKISSSSKSRSIDLHCHMKKCIYTYTHRHFFSNQSDLSEFSLTRKIGIARASFDFRTASTLSKMVASTFSDAFYKRYTIPLPTPHPGPARC